MVQAKHIRKLQCMMFYMLLFSYSSNKKCSNTEFVDNPPPSLEIKGNHTVISSFTKIMTSLIMHYLKPH